MEKINQRSMVAFVLSSLINAGIGLAFGMLVGIVQVIGNGGHFAMSIIISESLTWMVLVALLTVNMYRIYFYYRLSLDIDSICEGDGDENESYVTAIVLSMLTFGIYELYWTYKLAKRLKANAPRYGFKMLESGKDIVILNTFSFGFIGAWELIKYMNRISRVYNQTGVAPVLEGGVQ